MQCVLNSYFNEAKNVWSFYDILYLGVFIRKFYEICCCRQLPHINPSGDHVIHFNPFSGQVQATPASNGPSANSMPNARPAHLDNLRFNESLNRSSTSQPQHYSNTVVDDREQPPRFKKTESKTSIETLFSSMSVQPPSANTSSSDLSTATSSAAVTASISNETFSQRQVVNSDHVTR